VEVIVTIRFADGSSHEALILRLSGAVMRLALKDRADAVELTLSGEMWFYNEAQQEVFFEFALDSEAAQILVWNQRLSAQEFFRPMRAERFTGHDGYADARSPMA
jgi:hypothetical protein